MQTYLGIFDILEMTVYMLFLMQVQNLQIFVIGKQYKRKLLSFFCNYSALLGKFNDFFPYFSCNFIFNNEGKEQ